MGTDSPNLKVPTLPAHDVAKPNEGGQKLEEHGKPKRTHPHTNKSITYYPISIKEYHTNCL